MTKRLLILSRYGRLGASTRLRTMQYLPYLIEAGLQVETASLFDDAYVTALYARRRSKLAIVGYFLKRIAQLRAASRADVIWLEKEAFPWLPWPIEKWLLPAGIPIVSDFDDAVFHVYDFHRLALVRRMLGRKLDHVMASSRIVFAGNDYLARRARSAGARDIRHIPTVVDTQAYSPRSPTGPADGPKVGWIGTPKSWREHGAPLMDQIGEVLCKHEAIFSAIGAGEPTPPLDGFEFVPWTEETEIDSIRALDIGVMPLTDTPIARGKCGYKLIQYMACGIPVIASPVGVNSDIVEHGVNGYLASTPAEWREALDRLLGDVALRERMGKAGREKISAKYSIQSLGPQVAAIFSGLAAHGADWDKLMDSKKIGISHVA